MSPHRQIGGIDTWPKDIEGLYAIQDANWNVVAVVSTSGAVQERYTYTAYGKVEIRHADFTLVTNGSAVAWTVLYAGREVDAETGLYRDGTRYYSPDLGRFLARNAAGDAPNDGNRYRYMGGDPLGPNQQPGLTWLISGAGSPAPASPASDVPVPPNRSVRPQRGGRTVRTFLLHNYIEVMNPDDPGHKLYLHFDRKGYEIYREDAPYSFQVWT